MEEKEFLRKLCTAHAPSGREHWIYSIFEEGFKPYCEEVRRGNLNNSYAIKKGNGRKSIMLMAHADEVFMLVKEISDNGFVKFVGVGIDAKTLVSQEVVIHGKEKIEGIIGIKPPHIMTEEDRKKSANIDDLLIDTGRSKEFVEKNIKIGDFITIKRDMYELLNNNIAAKATDDRASIVSMLTCAKELQNIKHDLDVYFVGSCQEEVGHRGAKIATFDIEPTLGIAIDVTFDNCRLGDEDSEVELGKGPAICIGPNIHPKFRERLTDIADEYGIPYQLEVSSGATGTDAWDIQVTKSGIPTLLISIPQRYMHTSVEVLNMDDVKNTGRIIAKFIEKISEDDLEELLCF